MKTPFSYYGGKQRLASVILPLLHPHRLYNEPFAGGGAIFFAKEPSQVEVLNDLNKEIINFYRVLQTDYLSLESLVRVTLHSRRLHQDAQVIYDNPHLFTELRRAWAVWVLSSQSFASMLNGSFGYNKTSNQTTKKIMNKVAAFTEQYSRRLQNVQLECADAVYIIQSRDNEEALHYCDPPYYNSDMGHYGGYTQTEFERLLNTLASLKGKFLLSSYPSAVLDEYTKKHGWHTRRINCLVSVANASKPGKKKVEVLTANYAL